MIKERPDTLSNPTSRQWDLTGEQALWPPFKIGKMISVIQADTGSNTVDSLKAIVIKKIYERVKSKNRNKTHHSRHAVPRQMNTGGVPRRQSRFSNGPGAPPGGAAPPRGGFTSSNFRPVSAADNRPPPLKQ